MQKRFAYLTNKFNRAIMIIDRTLIGQVCLVKVPKHIRRRTLIFAVITQFKTTYQSNVFRVLPNYITKQRNLSTITT